VRRLAVENDLEEVFAIYMHDEVIPFLGFDALPADQFRPHFQDLLLDGDFFVVEVDGRVAGLYRLSRREGRARHVACLSTFAIAPGLRGGGLARQVLDDAILRLGAAGIRRVELTVESDNARAIAFYTKTGFEREGTLREAYRRATRASAYSIGRRDRYLIGWRAALIFPESTDRERW
jgi:ribosomal protein S18 acetylase RimI-like enzyme